MGTRKRAAANCSHPRRPLPRNVPKPNRFVSFTMCGITGFCVQNVESSSELRDQLRQMTAELTHRGPDDSGCWNTLLADGSWMGMGSTRLAILDLSSAGHMPMSTP